MVLNLRSFLLIIFSFFAISCSKNTEGESPDQLFEKYKSSVVIVAIQYYYEILFDGITIYYSPGSELEKKIFFYKNEALANLSFASGTGFIVSKNGEIITNNHVINPKDDSYLNELDNLKSVISNYLKHDIDNYSDTIRSINIDLNSSSELDDVTIENLSSKLIDLNQKKDNLSNSLERLQNFNIDSSDQKLVTIKIGIAYNDTHVSSLNDLQDCVIIKESKDPKVDLALIQTKSKIFNVPPNEIFSFGDNNSISKRFLAVIKRIFIGEKRNIQNPVKINDDVFMIGYNRGFTLANTRIGIKSQFTGGKISQESDGEKILYTIPTLVGSSGSPIIDKWGNLVGVNFAKITDSQNFGLGVPVYEVKRFYLK